MKRLLYLLFLFLSISLCYSADKELIFGGSEGWDILDSSKNVIQKPGFQGFDDLYIMDNILEPTEKTDLLLNGEAQPYGMGYRIVNERSSLYSKMAARGKGSYRFRGFGPAIQVEAGHTSLLAPGNSIDSFTIEFWLYPLTAGNGEVLLNWQGAALTSQGFIKQSIKAFFRGRRLTFSFQNIFRLPHGSFLPDIILRSHRESIPRNWEHHMIRFNGKLGLVEYLVNGKLSDVTHSSVSGREEKDIAKLYIGKGAAESLLIGERFAGLIDEFRISSEYINDFDLSAYMASGGEILTQPIDLGFTNSRLLKIETQEMQDNGAELLYYYKLSDRLPKETDTWKEFIPNEELPETSRGRFLQIKALLLPNIMRDKSPRISQLKIHYQEDIPPVPPAQVKAMAQDGQVHIVWKEVAEADIGGYLVYYGEAPENYWGTGALEGDSPINVNKKTELTINGLENKKLYFFAVVSYDQASPPHESIFSNEVNARPIRNLDE